MKFIGRNGTEILFTAEEKAVIVNEKTNLVSEVGSVETLIASFLIDESSPQTTPNLSSFDLANASVSSLDISVFSANDRLYTIPKAAQAEAKRALEWRKKNKRGGTPVGLNTARTLAKGGQIGIRKVRHIAKYFPRHEVDKKAKGYRPGEDGYPSNGRIAWALWGGDSARAWASQIVEREDKQKRNASAITASYKFVMDREKDASRVDLDSYKYSENPAEFFIRVRLDDSSIDRLYKMELDGSVFVWDDAMWEDLGHINHDFETYDKSLDDPYDSSKKMYLPIDIESALLISGILDADPFKKVNSSDLNSTESDLFQNAYSEIDWEFVDRVSVPEEVITAAGEGGSSEGDGVDTPKERSERASSQVRDKLGKFAKSGSRVIIGGNPNYTGVVKGMNPATQSLKVQLDNGNYVDVPGNTTQEVSSYAPIAQQKNLPDTNIARGILGEPRVPIDRPNVRLPGHLPPLTANDLSIFLNDWTSWAADKNAAARKEQVAPAESTTRPNVDKPATPSRANNAYNDPDLRAWLEKKVKTKSGETIYPNAGWYRPDISVDPDKYIEKYRKNTDPNQARGFEGDLLKKPKGLTSAAESNEVTPENSTVPPVFMAIVAEDDPQAVMDLVSLVPASVGSNSPSTFKRTAGKWERDDAILNDLNSATPPPVIVLSDELLEDVISQVDQSSGIDKEEQEESIVSALISAGGIDRNRGNAEKLRRYWLYGKGAAKIRWNTPGDWTRCVRQLSKYMGPRAKGYCALRHKEATGMWTGDKLHKQLYGKKGRGKNLFSTDVILSEDRVIENSALIARAKDARSRVLVAGAQTESMNGAEFFIPLVIPEGIESGDGRQFEKGSIDMRELPLPLLWQIKTGEGHNGSVVVGKIVSMEKTDQGIGNARGFFDTGEYGKEAERLVRGGFIRGVSADLDKFEADEEVKEVENESNKKLGAGKINITKARVMAVTLVPKPAFQECTIKLAENVGEQEENVIPDGVYVEGVNPLDASALVACGIVAGMIPVTPPKEWFEKPELKKATPLTVTDEGQVFGHIAAWHVDHIGLAFGTKPPRSKSKYAYFHTGVVRAQDGLDVPVGQLTLAGGHAPLEASASEAVRHYDDTASSVADVHAGEDAFGIWVAGALRPGTTPEQIRALRASAPSGDWRPIKGSLELVAVCQVNVPGFPIARARVASGQVMALVAAGASALAHMKHDPLAELNSKIEKLEEIQKAPLVATADQAKNKFKTLEMSIKTEELLSRVEKMKNEFSSSSDWMLQTFDDNTAELGYISRRVRERLAKEDKALPDGSFPIRNVSDLKNAVQAYGRAKPGNRAKVRRHIVRRARGLKRADLIPENWKEASDIEATVASLRERIDVARAVIAGATDAENGLDNDFLEKSKTFSDQTFADADEPLEGLTKEEIEALKQESRARKAKKEDSRTKYTPETQPRDAKGKFRQVLARIKQDLGDSGLDRALEKVEEAENLDNAGNYAGAAKAAGDLLGLIDRLDSGALNKVSLENVRLTAAELGKTIANLPFAFGEQAQKIRFSDVPPALKQLMEDMITRVEAKIGKDDADIATQSLRTFMAGGDYFNQSEISSEMSKLLRLLT